MKKYNVTGMSCAACSARVEKAVNAVEGVTSCSVSLLTNTMGVEGDAPAQAVIDAVIAAGYGASPADDGTAKGPSPQAAEKALADEQKKTETIIAEQKAKYDAELDNIRNLYDIIYFASAWDGVSE